MNTVSYGPNPYVLASRKRLAEVQAKRRNERVDRLVGVLRTRAQGFPEIIIEKRSSMNAVKSGLFAKSPVIKTKHGEESDEDFRKLLDDLRTSFAPQGAYEENLVWQIACHVQCGQRGIVYEASTAKRNEEIQMRELEDQLGLRALKDNLTAAQTRIQRIKNGLEVLSTLPPDLVKAAQTEFHKYRVPLRLLYDFLWEDGSLAVKLQLERAWKLERFHVVLQGGIWKNPPAQLYGILLATKKNDLAQAEAEYRQLQDTLAAGQSQLEKMMSEDPLRFLLPSTTDVERLDRYYSMHDRTRKKKIDELMHVQLMRIRKSQALEEHLQLGISANGSRPASGLVEQSVAAVNQTSAGKERGNGTE